MEIVNIYDQETALAHTQSSAGFPLGKTAWQFVSDNCTDPGPQDGGLRTLFLHLEVALVDDLEGSVAPEVQLPHPCQEEVDEVKQGV